MKSLMNIWRSTHYGLCLRIHTRCQSNRLLWTESNAFSAGYAYTLMRNANYPVWAELSFFIPSLPSCSTMSFDLTRRSSDCMPSSTSDNWGMTPFALSHPAWIWGLDATFFNLSYTISPAGLTPNQVWWIRAFSSVHKLFPLGIMWLINWIILLDLTIKSLPQVKK